MSTPMYNTIVIIVAGLVAYYVHPFLGFMFLFAIK